MNQISEPRQSILKDGYPGFRTLHFAGQIGNDMHRLEQAVTYAYAQVHPAQSLAHETLALVDGTENLHSPLRAGTRIRKLVVINMGHSQFC